MEQKNTNCESCMMPFSKDTGVRESEQYCSLCYRDGKLCYEGDDVNEFKKACYEKMTKNGMNKWKAKFFVWMIGFAPRWNKKK